MKSEPSSNRYDFLRRTQRIATAISVTFALTACGEDFFEKKTEIESNPVQNPSDDGNAEGGNPPEFGNQPPQEAQSPFRDAFGTWAAPCIEGEDGYADRTFYVFEQTAWLQRIVIYVGGNDCDPSATIAISDIFGGVSFDVLSEDDADTFAWDGRIQSYQRSFHRLDVIEDVNSMQLHGYNDWELNEAKECIGRPDNSNRVLNPQTIKAILRVAEGDTMQLAIQNDPESGRPEDFEGEDTLLLEKL